MSDPKPPREGTSREMLAEIQQLLSQLDSHKPVAREAGAAARSTPLHPRHQPEPRIDGGRTLEEIVSDLLRPMLRRWLGENLPRLVQPGLRDEIARSLLRADADEGDNSPTQ
jgi:hypothetical protein